MLLRNPLLELSRMVRRALPHRQAGRQSWRRRQADQRVEPLELRTLLSTQSYHSVDVPLTVANSRSGSTTVSSLSISDDRIITSLQVSLEIQHPNDSDLTAELVSPDGTRIVLFNRIGGTGDDFTATVLDDSATDSIDVAVAPFTGTFRPEQTLSTFSGKHSNGMWQLLVTDSNRTNSGSLIGWSLTVVDTLTDEGDTISTARNRAFSYSSPYLFTNEISSVSDVDLLAVSLLEGDLLTASLDVGGGGLQGGVRVFDSAGLELASNHTSGANTPVSVPVTMGGTYYVGVSSFGNQTYDPVTGTPSAGTTTGTFMLWLARQESGQTLETARPVVLGYESQAVNGNVHVATDVDLYAVTLLRGDTLSVDLVAAGSSLSGALRLFDNLGTELAAGESHVDFAASAGGTYYIGVASHGNAAYDPITGATAAGATTGGYALQLNRREAGSTLATAMALATGYSELTVAGSISLAGDVDLFSIVLIAGDTLTADVDAAVQGSTLDSVLRIFDSTGMQVGGGFNDDSGRSTDSLLPYTATISGQFYVGISSHLNADYNPLTGAGTPGTTLGAYSLRLSRQETGGTLGTASTVALDYGTGVTIHASVNSSRDVDMYAVTLLPGDRLTVGIAGVPAESFTGGLRLFDSTGAQLASNLDESGLAAPQVTFVATTAGTYYLGASSFGNLSYNPVGDGRTSRGSLPTGDYALQLFRSGAGRTLASATVLPLQYPGTRIPRGPSAVGSIASPAEVDFFAFTLAAGDTLTAAIDAAVNGSTLDSVLRLFDSAGVEVQQNDNFGGSTDSLLVAVAAVSGTYYLGVSSHLNSAYNPLTGVGAAGNSTGSYSLRLTRRETGNTLATATSVSLDYETDRVVEAAIDPATDVDLFAVSLLAGDTLSVEIAAANGSGFGGGLRLFDNSGHEVATSLQADGSSQPQLKYKIGMDGSYYLGVSSLENLDYDAVSGSGAPVASAGGSYSVTFSRLTPGNLLETASQVPLLYGSTVTVDGTIDPASDVDLYVITLNAGDRLVADIDAAVNGSTLNSVLRLFNAAGVEVAVNHDSGGPDSKLEFAAMTTGQYYLGVSSDPDGNYLVKAARRGASLAGTAGTTSGTYSLKLTVADPGGTLATASPVALGYEGSVSLMSRVANISDVDLFAVTLSAGDILTAAFQGGDPLLRIFDVAGTEVARNDDSAAMPDSRLAYTAPLTGVYYVGVSAYQNSRYDPNTGALNTTFPPRSRISSAENPTLQLTRWESGATLTTATAVEIGTGEGITLREGINPADDVDLFSVALQAGDIVHLDLRGADEGTPHGSLRIFGSDGAPLDFTPDADSLGGLQTMLNVTVAGTYYIGVSGAGNTGYNPVTGTGSTSGATGNYTLALRRDVVNLTAFALHLPDGAVSWGEPARIQFAIQNTGNLASSAFEAKIMVLGGRGNTLQRELETVHIPGIAAHGIRFGEVTVMMPGSPGTPPSGFPVSGNLTFKLVVDTANAVQEGDENDNYNQGPGIDLASAALTAVLADLGANTQETAEILFPNSRILAGNEGGDRWYRLQLEVDGTLNLKFGADGTAYPYELALYDAQGQLLDTAGKTADALAADLRADLDAGMYFVRLRGLPTGGRWRLESAFAAGTASNPIGIQAVATQFVDLNSDGQRDLITLNAASNSVSVLLGRRDGTFAPAVEFAVGLSPTAITVADLNNDQQLDLLIATRYSNVSVLLGRGDGTFAASSHVAVGKAASDLVLADVNGDHLPDLVTANAGSNDLSVLFGRNDGTFAAETRHSVGANPNAIRLVDLNHDAWLDLVISNQSSGDVSVLLGQAGGTFAPQFRHAVGTNPKPVQVADVNADGWLDLVTANAASNDVSVLLNRKDGTFAPQVRYTVGEGPNVLRIVNVPGGSVSLVTSNLNSDDVSVLRGLGNGTFAPQVRYATGDGPGGLQVVDVNQDHFLDLVTVNQLADNVSVLLGRADGTFSTQLLSAVAFLYPNALQVDDVNHDSVPDLVAVSSQKAQAAVMFGHGEGTFAAAFRNAVGNFPTSLLTTDLNHDGRPDLVTVNTASNDLSVLLGRVDGTFAVEVRYAVGDRPGAVQILDVNGDGRPDLVVANAGLQGELKDKPGQESVSVLLGRGDGTFAPEIRLPVGDNPRFLQLADVNRDGRLDVITLNTNLQVKPPPGAQAQSHVSANVSVLLSQRDGTFTKQTQYSVGVDPRTLQVVDISGDGLPDIITANYESKDISILLGSADGKFLPQTRIALGSNPVTLQIADLNHDAQPDLTVANSSQELVVFLANGRGTFQPKVVIPLGVSISSLQILDINPDFTPQNASDNHLDLVAVSGASSQVLVLTGMGNGTFTVSSATFVSGLGSVQFRDVDGDKVRDLITANTSTHDVSVLLGTGNGSFLGETRYAVGFNPTAIQIADLNGDGRLDLATADSNSNRVTVLFGTGTGTFVSPPSFRNSGVQAALGDVNGDQIPDIAMLNLQGDVLVRAGRDDSGDFAPVEVFATGQAMLDLTVVHGRKADGTAARYLAALRRNGTGVDFFGVGPNGNLQPLTEMSLTFTASVAKITAGDLDGDGFDELIVARIQGLWIFGSTPGGEFSQRADLPTGFGIATVTVADLDHTGFLDIAVAESESSSLGHFLNRGSFQFSASRFQAVDLPYQLKESAPGQTFLSALDHVSGVDVGDFNTDGITDIATLNADASSIVILAGVRTGGFVSAAAAQSIALESTPKALVAGDFNADGRPDFAVLMSDQQSITVLLGTGGGKFVAGQRLSVGPGTVSLNLQEVVRSQTESSARRDLLVGNAFGDVLILAGRADGSFAPPVRADQDVALAVGDVDGDGKEDVITASRALDKISLSTNIRLSDQNAASGTAIATGQTQTQTQDLLGPGGVTIVNLNDDDGDGRIGPGDIADLVVPNSGGNTVLVYQGLGQGTFSAPVVYFAGSSPAGVTIADVNADGRPDIIIANQGSNDISILLNQAAASAGGMATFTPGPRLNTGVGSGPVSTQVMDITNDGILDLVVTNAQNGTVSLLAGVGGGFFNDVNPAFLSLGNLGSVTVTPPTADNPTTTLVGTSSQTGQVVVVSNLQQAFFAADPSQFIQRFDTGGQAPSGLVVTDFNRDGRFDLVIANSGSSSVTFLTGSGRGFDKFFELRANSLRHPSELALSADGLQLYCADEGEEVVTVFDMRKLLAERDELEEMDDGKQSDSGNVTFSVVRQSLLAGLASSSLTVALASLLSQLGDGVLTARRSEGLFNIASEFLDFHSGSGIQSLSTLVWQIATSRESAEELYTVAIANTISGAVTSLTGLAGLELSDESVAAVKSWITPIVRKYVEVTEATPEQLLKIGIGVLRAVQRHNNPASDAELDGRAGSGPAAASVAALRTLRNQSMSLKFGHRSTVSRMLSGGVKPTRRLSQLPPKASQAAPVKRAATAMAAQATNRGRAVRPFPAAQAVPVAQPPRSAFPSARQQGELDRVMALLVTDGGTYDSLFTAPDEPGRRQLAGARSVTFPPT